MEELKLPITFPSCPNCGCGKKISSLAVQGGQKGDIPAFSFLKRDPLPLEDPRKAVLTVRTLVTYYDICAKCGMEYCTKAEIVNVEIRVPGPLQPV